MINSSDINKNDLIEAIREYIKDNLKIYVSVNRDENYAEFKVRLELDGYEISENTDCVRVD